MATRYLPQKIKICVYLRFSLRRLRAIYPITTHTPDFHFQGLIPIFLPIPKR